MWDLETLSHCFLNIFKKILVNTSKGQMALENRILPESKSPLPLAELGCFSKGEDEGSGILVAGKLLSIAKEEGSSLNSSCRKNYLRATDKEKNSQIHVFLNSPKLIASCQSCYYFIITCRMQCSNNTKYQESRLISTCLHKVNNKGHNWAKSSIFYQFLSSHH